MRLIDADAMMEKYNDWYTEDGEPNGVICTVGCLLRKEPTIGGWISVKERMPEPNVSVLLAVYDRDHGYTYRTVAWLYTSGDWDSNDDGFNQGDEDVLYWMPLPEPPEEVRGDA